MCYKENVFWNGRNKIYFSFCYKFKKIFFYLLKIGIVNCKIGKFFIIFNVWFVYSLLFYFLLWLDDL